MLSSAADLYQMREALARKLVRDGSARHPNVELAFRRVARHLFLPEVDPDLAYRDTPIPTKLEAGEVVSSSSQPSIMAVMLEQLRTRSGHHVLEIGAGTGYNAALLSELVGQHGRVTTIDLDIDTVQRARAALAATGYTGVHVAQGDGLAGYPSHAPYDRIIATVGLGDIPTAWREQLKPGGHLVLPLAIRGVMRSVAFQRDGRGRLTSTSLVPANFMPFRGNSPLLSKLVRVGPELGLFAWFPPDRGATDVARLHAALQRQPVDLATGIRVARRQRSNGLNFWIRARQSTMIVLQAEGALVDTGIVPAFGSQLGSFATRESSTLGLYEGDESDEGDDGDEIDVGGDVALLGWQNHTAYDGQNAPDELIIRAFGRHGLLTKRLLTCIQAWQSAGSPPDDTLEMRIGAQPETGDAVIPLPSCELVLRWGSSSR